MLLYVTKSDLTTKKLLIIIWQVVLMGWELPHGATDASHTQLKLGCDGS